MTHNKRIIKKQPVQPGRAGRAKKVLAALKKLFPGAGISLRYSNPWELLVAVMLSAQCTDKKVNEITAQLFKKYRSFNDYRQANARVFEKDIKSSGFYRAKTKHILAAARIIQEKFQGLVPASMAELTSLPGVARKTANVVLGNAFNIVEGIAVDTHVRRFALKLNLTRYTDPAKIERDLMAIIPKKDWFQATYLFIEYGRGVCPARKHLCEKHPLSKIYPEAAQRWPKAG